MASSTSFNSSAQNITITMPDGSSLYVLISDINNWFYYAVRVSTNYGAQVGACFIMLLVTLFLARDSQWRKLVHNFNLISLVLGLISGILQVTYFSSRWEEFRFFFTNDRSELKKSDFQTSVAGTVMPLLMRVFINMSLALQAHSVCKVMSKKKYYAIFFLSCIILLVALTWRFVECVTNSLTITSDSTYFNKDYITTGTLATEAISIWWFAGLFMWKLGWTIWTRKKMGWANLKMLDRLMIGGGCTMIIPSIFAGLGFARLDTFPEAGPLAMATVALLLPLSTLWAAKATTSHSVTFNLSSFVGSRSLSAEPEDGSATGPNTFGSLSTISGPLVSYRDAATGVRARGMRDSSELDLEAMGVRVDQSYSVSTARPWLEN